VVPATRAVYQKVSQEKNFSISENISDLWSPGFASLTNSLPRVK